MTWSFHPYAIPLREPYRWAKGAQTVRRGLLVAYETEGHTGWGEVAPPPHLAIEPARIAAFARKGLRVPLAQDDVPLALDAAGCGPRLRAGLAGAWLDAHARMAGEPLARFAARRARLDKEPAREVPVNALILAKAPDACVHDGRQAVREGYTTLKLKSDGDREADMARLAAVRGEVGAGIRLRLDPNGSFGADALARLRELAPFGLEYVEQPVPPEPRDALVRILQASPVPIALDEAATSWQAVAPLAHFRPVLVAKPQRLGGIDRAAAFIGNAAAAGLRCVVTNSLETAVGRLHALHAASLLPNPIPACGLATAGLLAHDVAATPAPAGGTLALPGGPGLGLAPDLEAFVAPAVE